MLTACKQTLISTSKAAAGVVGRHQRGESEVVSTIAATRTIPVVDPMQREATRATLRSRLFTRRRRQATTVISRCWAHLSEQGFGAIQRLFLSAFDYVLACVGQRGSRSRQTGDMVYRMGMAMAGRRPWIAHGSIWDRRDGKTGTSSLCTTYLLSGGPGEPLGGSVRPRGRSLRPPRAWTAPTADACISPGREKG